MSNSENVTAIKNEIASIGKAGKALDTRIQKCAVKCLEHMIEHRDHSLLTDLYAALSKGQRRASMAAWIMSFTQLAANTDAASKGTKPFVLDKAKKADIVGAVETMWYDCGAPEKAPDEIMDMNKIVAAMLKKVAAAREAGRVVKGLSEENLAMLTKLSATVVEATTE